MNSRNKKFLLGIGVVAVVTGIGVAEGNDVLRIFESDAPSRSVGSPGNGRIEHGKRLPTRGSNFRTYSRLGSLLGRTCVHQRVRDAVIQTYQEIYRAKPQLRFVFGETGWPRGGRMRPHRTHQNGLSVDFMVPVRQKGRIATLSTWPWQKFGYGAHFDGDGRGNGYAIDLEALAFHLEILHGVAERNGLKIELVILAPDLQDDLFATEAGRRLRDTVPFSRRAAWVRHDQHYHVDFRLSDKGAQ